MRARPPTSLSPSDRPTDHRRNSPEGGSPNSVAGRSIQPEISSNAEAMIPDIIIDHFE
jgi:hypothetical protein